VLGTALGRAGNDNFTVFSHEEALPAPKLRQTGRKAGILFFIGMIIPLAQENIPPFLTAQKGQKRHRGRRAKHNKNMDVVPLIIYVQDFTGNGLRFRFRPHAKPLCAPGPPLPAMERIDRPPLAMVCIEIT
jgi:hypothetical protein